MFLVCLCYAVFSIPCSLVITCWEKTDLLALLCVMFCLVFCTFPYGVPGQVCHLIVSISDFAFFLLCVQLSSYLEGGGSLTLMMALHVNQKHDDNDDDDEDDDDEQALNFVEPDLGPNSLKRLSAEITRSQRYVTYYIYYASNLCTVKPV